MTAAAVSRSRPPLFPTRKIVHISMLGFAFLLPFLTWLQAAGAAMLALLFNLLILPRLGVDLRKQPSGEFQALDASSEENIWTGIILYPVSVLTLILIYRHRLDVVAAVWAILALGDGAASVAGQALEGPALAWNRRKTWAGFLAFVFVGTAGAYALARWVTPSLPAEKTLVISALTALLGAVVESLPIRLDDNVSVPLVCGGFMYCASFVEASALASNLPYLPRRMALAAAVNLVFALVALRLKTVSHSGAAAGFVLGWLVYLGWGWRSFLILFSFFLLGSLATRLGYRAKERRGIAQRHGGARSWREALANVSPGAFFAPLVITTHQEHAFLVALVAAFAEAAGDTASSEIGQWLSSRAYLITTLEPVPSGENGGVSWAGTLAGLLASALIAALGLLLGLTGLGGAAIAGAAAVAGNLLDSLLGATLEQRGLVTNGVVNFAATSLAGALALAFTLR
jgi:uncharacterized protein (TIGR00297 family)